MSLTMSISLSAMVTDGDCISVDSSGSDKCSDCGRSSGSDECSDSGGCFDCERCSDSAGCSGSESSTFLYSNQGLPVCFWAFIAM